MRSREGTHACRSDLPHTASGGDISNDVGQVETHVARSGRRSRLSPAKRRRRRRCFEASVSTLECSKCSATRLPLGSSHSHHGRGDGRTRRSRSDRAARSTIGCQLARHCDARLAESFLLELAPIGAAQRSVTPDRVHRCFTPQEPQERVALLRELADGLPTGTRVIARSTSR
jgi:hypothetical protein